MAEGEQQNSSVVSTVPYYLPFQRVSLQSLYSGEIPCTVANFKRLL